MDPEDAPTLWTNPLEEDWAKLYEQMQEWEGKMTDRIHGLRNGNTH